MSPLEIGVLAYQAGIHNQTSLQKAIAIALAESSGNPNAVGDVGLQDEYWGPSIGLWQIRSVKKESGKGTTRDATQLKSPTFNAKSMYTISGGGKNFGPWTTWPLRATAYLPVAIPAATSVIAGQGAIETATDIVDTTGIPAAVEDLTALGKGTYNWVSNRDNWIRVAQVIIGGALIIVGIVVVAKPVITPVVDAASKVVPAGKALKGK